MRSKTDLIIRVDQTSSQIEKNETKLDIKTH